MVRILLYPKFAPLAFNSVWTAILTSWTVALLASKDLYANQPL